MPCSPKDNNLNPAAFPKFKIPGFDIFPSSPVQLPVPGFKFPDGFPEDLLALLNNLTIPWPGGSLVPNMDDLTNSILKALSSIFNAISPYLCFYSFFTALLNMIMCVIDILCALSNPFKLIKAMRKLIKQCLPPFLNLFPWLALLAMLLALLQLLLALIEYIIARILQLLEDLLKNLILMGKGASFNDADSTAAVAIKISSLLCLIEDLMAIFTSVAAIMAIIESLANMGGSFLCGGDGGDCCGDDTCPPFIADNPDGLVGDLGKLKYYGQIDADMGAGGWFFRPESWQFVSDDVTEYPFKSIITSYDGGDIFWPEGTVFSSETSLRKAPYTLTLTLKNFNPKPYNPLDDGDPRTFEIRDCIVSVKPYIGITDQVGGISYDNLNGTLSIIGGLVFEESGEPYLINGVQATLNTFIHKAPNTSGIAPLVDDAVNLTEIEYTLKINHGSLMGFNLITLGCIPEVKSEVTAINATLDIRPLSEKVPSFPNITGAQKCVADIISNLRKDVSPETVEAAKVSIVGCLEDLRTQTLNTFCSTFMMAADIYNSTFVLNPNIQIVKRTIPIEVTLRDAGGTDIGNKLPPECIDDITSNLKAVVTLGTASDFSYIKETGKFTSNIASKVAGTGEAKVTWKENYLSTITGRDNVDADTQIEILSLPYEFIPMKAVEGKDRRDSTDVANSG